MSQSILSNYEFKKYVCTIEDVKSTLEKYGVAIIPDILSQNECDEMLSGFWHFLEHITANFDVPIKREQKETWKNFKKLYPAHSMLLQHFGIGHAQFMWNLRQNRKVLNVFSTIWNTLPKNLITSFDGASFHFPPEVTKSGYFRGNSWLHTDQSYTRPLFECIQSWVTALDVNEGDATLTFLEGSHKFHKEFSKEFKITDKGDWNKIKDSEQLNFYLDRGCIQKYISCPKGSMVLWDSRTIHCGQESLKERKSPNFRCIGYICMTPRDRATPKMIQKRIKAFEELRSTNHYPYKTKLFAKVPRTYGGEIPNVKPITAPVINDIGRRLVGYN